MKLKGICLHETSGQKDDRVDEAHNPLIMTLSIDAKFLREGQIGTIGTGLIPTLSRSTHSAKTDRVPEHKGSIPFVISFICKYAFLLFSQRYHILAPVLRISCHEGCPTKQVSMFAKIMGCSK